MDWLKCKICFNTYNESTLRPHALSCGHTFCEKCLNNTIQDATLTCPKCRKIHKIKSVLELPINFDLEELVKSLKTCSQDINEGAISCPIEEDSVTDEKSEAKDSLKSLLEQQKISLSAQKELIKTSAGLCYDHPSKESMFRCSLHMSWVCEQCVEDQGDHPKHKCKIINFKEELEFRRQEYKRSLEEERNLCDETSTVIERYISFLRDKKEHHHSLINLLKKEEEILQNDITSFQNIIEKGKFVNQSLLNVETTVLSTLTLDESNAARDLVRNKKVEARNWVNNSKEEMDEGKLKIETFISVTSFDENSSSPSNILLGLNNKKEIYAETTVSGKKIISKLSSKNKNLHVSTFKCENMQRGANIFKYEEILGHLSGQAPTLLYLDLAYNNTQKGRIYMRIEPQLHSFIKHIPALFTGLYGKSILGNKCGSFTGNGLAIWIKEDANGISSCNKIDNPHVKTGDILCNDVGEKIHAMFISLDSGPIGPIYDSAKIGHVVSGLDVAKDCKALGNTQTVLNNITITDCGLVLEI